MMDDKKKRKPRGMSGALGEWDAALADVMANPTPERLDWLCTLLDVMDTDIVRLWGDAGHDDRRDCLRERSAEARQANALVTAEQVRVAQEQGRVAYAARKAKREAA